MAVDMFLNIADKKIKGESRDNTHKDEIEVLAWSWGVSNSGSAHIASGGGTGKANFQDLSVTKYIDMGSTDLQVSCAKGTHYPKAVLTVRKAGDNPLEYIIITMNEVMVTSVSTGGSGGEDRLTENITLTFSKVSMKYTGQDGTGKAVTPAKEYTFDIGKNVTV